MVFCWFFSVLRSNQPDNRPHVRSSIFILFLVETDEIKEEMPLLEEVATKSEDMFRLGWNNLERKIERDRERISEKRDGRKTRKA